MGQVDREVLEWKEVCRAMYDDMDVLNGLDQLDKEDVARLSKELYRAIHMATTMLLCMVGLIMRNISRI